VSTVLAASSSPVLWYVARGSGAVALVLLTLSVAGGVVTSVRWSSERYPRFVIQLLHRNISLLAVVFIVIHIATVVIDGFAPIGWIDAVVPFRSGYRPLWLGLGAIAFDLVLALIITSLLRQRIGQRTWRIVHWSSYVCWPLVVLHGLGAGSDAQSELMLATTAACFLLVVLAVWWRLAQGWPERAGARVAGVTATLVMPLLLVAWLGDGPLAPGWAARAGTPRSLLGSSGQAAVATAAPPATTPVSAFPAPPFSAGVSGSLTRRPTREGLLTIDVALQLVDGASGNLDIALQGEPTRDGGVLMQTSQVQLDGGASGPRYAGQISALDGNTVVAELRDGAGARAELTAVLRISAGDRITGQVRLDPVTRAQGGRGESGEHGGGNQERGSE
jgi:methionine sulfoxide reductase heme-binding subunit